MMNKENGNFEDALTKNRTWFVRYGNPDAVHHAWRDGDTICRMASTGGLRLARYQLVERVTPGRVCHMCAVVASDQPVGER